MGSRAEAADHRRTHGLKIERFAFDGGGCDGAGRPDIEFDRSAFIRADGFGLAVETAGDVSGVTQRSDQTALIEGEVGPRWAIPNPLWGSQTHKESLNDTISPS